ncbi:MAG: hypothetical protein RLZZ387_2587 [Chloroflexota bacterium]|jgi:hypothetical protein
MYVIEKNVPMPATRENYPLKVMEVGDSFVLPLDKLQNVRITINNLKRRNPGCNFVTRTTGDVGRVWRTA